MAKPPPVIRVRLVCTQICEVAELGPAMLKASEAGFDDVRYDFFSDIEKFKERAQNGTSGHVHLAEWIKEHATFKARDVVKHFAAEGRSAGSAYTSIRMLVENKTLKALGNGNYSRADVVALDSPRKKPRNEKGVNNMTKYDPPHPQFLISAIKRNHGRCNRAWVMALFAKNERPESSASPTLMALVKAKKLKRVGDGEYAVPTKATKKTKAPKTNSGAVTGATEQAHG